MTALEGQLDEVRRALREEGTAPLDTVTGPLGAAEWAWVLVRLPSHELREAALRLPTALLPEIVAEVPPRTAAELAEQLPPPQGAALLRALDPDDAVDLLAHLRAGAAQELLGRLPAEQGARLRQLLTYPPDTAGGRMTPQFVAVQPHLSADQAIGAIRQAAREAETVYSVYVVDGGGAFLGILSLRDLVLAPPETPVRGLMTPHPVSVQVDTDQEVAARLLVRLDLLALPVLDAQGHLVGILTEDDVADVLEEEATEDFERLGGSQPLEMPYRRAGATLLFRKRLPWLLALFVAEAYTGNVMRYFEDTLEQVVALAFFIPLLLGTGGNVGSQITTTLVRAMAVDDLGLRDLRWILGKEFAVGLLIGVVMAVIAFGRAWMLGVGMDVGTVVALAIAAITIWSSVVAAALPLALRRLRFDPTVVSAPFITTLVDGTGLVIYFLIARSVLGL
ncbi:magnesium transporter [Deinococcus radiopugnans]|uniref:Magnesium transporter MgtE n=1 Tax=Deinococcus radiopugnans ATCC 19172 TaxID=585398 RepID=A0A5C4YBZ5_9DEIO|nr:magnesium transporter [Deinococcus radiopugnans]MBB6015352.1 magnesium transporter [Deinococcus radiopugnans ATCC 19172]TNM72954.1 magnesium transporter [Deinococcus radiopugnans ATCC 19172]